MVRQDKQSTPLDDNVAQTLEGDGNWKVVRVRSLKAVDQYV